MDLELSLVRMSLPSNSGNFSKELIAQSTLLVLSDVLTQRLYDGTTRQNYLFFHALMLQDLCTQGLTHLGLQNNDVILQASATLQSLEWMRLIEPEWDWLEVLEDFTALTSLTLSVDNGYLLMGNLAHCLRHLTLLKVIDLTNVIGEDQSILQPFTHMKW